MNLNSETSMRVNESILADNTLLIYFREKMLLRYMYTTLFSNSYFSSIKILD